MRYGKDLLRGVMATLLVLVMCLGMFPTAALAAETRGRFQVEADVSEEDVMPADLPDEEPSGLTEADVIEEPAEPAEPPELIEAPVDGEPAPVAPPRLIETVMGSEPAGPFRAMDANGDYHPVEPPADAAEPEPEDEGTGSSERPLDSGIFTVGIKGVRKAAARAAAAEGTATFADLQKAVNGTSVQDKIEYADGKVTLLCDVEYAGSGDTASVTVSVGKTIVLDLNGHNVDGKGSNNNNVIVNRGTLMLENGASTEGSVTGGTCGIRTYGTFIMNGGKISGNHADKYGGGIYIYGGTVTITGGEISNNQAGLYGGGIYHSSSDMLEISGGKIVNNETTTYYGGGIYASRAEGTIRMTGGEISGNKAGGRGGGVWTRGKLEMSGDALISSNTAANGSGGGVYVGGDGSLTMRGGLISGNRADTDSTGKNGNGGGISNGGFCTIDHCLITGHTTKSAGGICNLGGTLTLKNGSTVSDNHASTSNGGGIRNAEGGTLTLTDVTVSGNSAKNYGGGIDSDSTSNTVTLTNSTVSGNSAGHGGGIRNSGTLTMTDSTITENKADSGYGGGVYSSGFCTMEHCEVTDNTASTAGGICSGTSGTLELKNSAIEGNTANDVGGILSNGTCTAEGCTITGNTASTSAGGVYSNGALTLTGGNTVSGNHAGEYGGGIYVYGPGTLTLADGDTLCNNHAAEGGDDISLEPGTSFSLAKTGEWYLEDGQMVLDDPDSQKLSDEGIVVDGKLKIDGWCFDGVGCTRPGCEDTRWAYRTHGHELTDLDQEGIADFIDLKAAHVSAKVGYSWDGLPDGSTLKDGTPAVPPDGGFYFRGESVAVDKEYGKDSTIKTDGVNYGFSGWDIDEDFVMTADDVEVKGTWSMYSHYDLPKTGGTGVMPVYGIGGMLALCGYAALVGIRKRKDGDMD